MEQTVRIPLTQGKFALIDAADYERVSRLTWYALNKDGLWYAANVTQAPRTEPGKPGKSRTLYLHQFITDAPDATEVDHWNGDGLDNRRENLRVCIHAENTRNQRLRADNTSGYKGVVSSGNQRESWVAAIIHDKHHYHLGTFATPRAAALAYDAKARELYGEFAHTNFPPSDDPLPAPMNLPVHNSSGFRGVSWHKQRGGWCAVVQCDGKKHHVGMYATAIEAAHAYDARARELHGARARVNFPDKS
jgi:hypothetical protein